MRDEPGQLLGGDFRARSFELASPLDPARWLSREYWEATRAAGEAPRDATSLAVVGARYEELIESLRLSGCERARAYQPRPVRYAWALRKPRS